jgi:PAS domain S-box-containing protein
MLLGRTPESMIGKRIWTEFPNDVGEGLRRVYEKAMLDQNPVHIEEYFPAYDRWFANFIYPSENGVSVYFHDISRRKREEQIAKDSAKRLRDLIDGLGPSMFVGLATTQGHLLEANRPALDAAGLSLEDVVGKPIEETYWFSNSDETKARIRAAIERGAQGQASRFDIQIRGIGEQLISVDFSLRPLRSEKGEVVFLVPSAQVITEREEALAALRASMAQTQKLSSEVIKAQEDERRRIARELHDELGQSLTAIKINLVSRARFKGHSSENVDLENIQIIEETLQQVRRLALGLRPSVLDDFGLFAALDSFIKQTALRNGFTLHFDATANIDRFDADIETCCFRVAQEALTNVIKHAQATHVTVRLHQHADKLILEIIDDGLGFDVSEVLSRARGQRTFGLRGIQERAMLIGAEFEIESHQGQGCKVRVTLSLPTVLVAQ